MGQSDLHHEATMAPRWKRRVNFFDRWRDQARLRRTIAAQRLYRQEREARRVPYVCLPHQAGQTAPLRADSRERARRHAHPGGRARDPGRVEDLGADGKLDTLRLQFTTLRDCYADVQPASQRARDRCQPGGRRANDFRPAVGRDRLARRAGEVEQGTEGFILRPSAPGCAAGMFKAVSRASPPLVRQLCKATPLPLSPPAPPPHHWRCGALQL